MKKIFLLITTILIIFFNISLFTKEKDINTYSNTIANIMIINNDNTISKDYMPSEMYKLSVPFIDDAIEEEMYMEEVAGISLEKLFKQANEEGIEFLATSAYRSFDEQERIYSNSVSKIGKRKTEETIAIPGTSEHQTGLSIDVTNHDRWFVEQTKEAQWLKHNAHRFGFIIRYPKDKEHITGKKYEPWHIRYVGNEVASYIYEQDITLEEYINK